MGSGPFTRRAAGWLIGTVSVSLLVWLVVVLVGQGLHDVESAGADSYSRSAIGHHAFRKLLEEIGVPVLVSRHATAGRAGSTAVLVLAEPQVGGVFGERATRLGALLEQAGTVLLVLPKWEVQEDEDAPGKIRANRLLGTLTASRALEIAGVSGTLVRPGEAAFAWTRNELGVEPTVERLQMVASEDLEPIVAAGGHILLGEADRDEGRLLVLSDPDVISNHGLPRGANAELAVRIIEMLREGERPVIIDETVHGHQARPAMWRQLFGFPLVLVTLQVVLVLGLLLWSALGRFGAPEPERTGVAPGKGVLIDNTAELLLFAGHSTVALERYLRAAVLAVGRALHAPPGGPASIRDWLSALGAKRGAALDVCALENEVRALRSARRGEEARVLTAARRIHRWKEEMLDGSGSGTRRHGAS